MRFTDIIESYPRHYNADRYPVVTHVDNEAEKFSHMERKIADQTSAKIVGHDEAGGGLLTVHVACVSEEIANRIPDRWSA